VVKDDEEIVWIQMEVPEMELDDRELRGSVLKPTRRCNPTRS
jgi:hypothetical protein